MLLVCCVHVAFAVCVLHDKSVVFQRVKPGMEIAPGYPQLAAEQSPACLSDAKPKRRKSKRTCRPQLLTRDQLDGRANAAKFFDQLATNIENDLGGHDQLSAIERSLVEAFCGAAVTLQNLNTRLALGEAIDVSQHSQCVGAMVRVASRLGLQRRAVDVGPGLGDLLRRDHERQRLEAQQR
jgi:hypothetical protein